MTFAPSRRSVSGHEQKCRWPCVNVCGECNADMIRQKNVSGVGSVAFQAEILRNGPLAVPPCDSAI